MKRVLLGDRVMNPNNHPQPPATSNHGLRVADNKPTHLKNQLHTELREKHMYRRLKWYLLLVFCSCQTSPQEVKFTLACENEKD
jgi:hypothetical protein